MRNTVFEAVSGGWRPTERHSRRCGDLGRGSLDLAGASDAALTRDFRERSFTLPNPGAIVVGLG
jgi:hypothetical protein